MEAGDPDVMERKPRDAKASILDKQLLISISVQSIAIAVSSLLAYTTALKLYPDNLTLSRTITFTTLITAELLRAYSSRSQRYSLFKIGFFSNITMVLGTSFSFLLMLLVLYIPFMQEMFETVSLAFVHWEIVLLFAFIPLVIGELYKLIDRKF